MSNSVSATQTICVYAGGLLLGLLDIACLIIAIKRGRWHPFEYHLSNTVFFLCSLLPATVAGCWIGGAVSRVWRSPPGKVLFITLSGGLLGGIAAAAGATHWMVDRHEFLWNLAQTVIPAATLVIGTIIGLVAGYVIGRRGRRSAQGPDCPSIREELLAFVLTALWPVLLLPRAGCAFVRRAGPRWSIAALSLVFVLGVSAILLWPTWKRAAAESELQQALAATQEAQPEGWKLEDLERRREHVADEANGSKIISAAAELLEETNFREWLDEAHSPVMLQDQQAADLRAELTKLQSALKTARRMIDYPKGRFPPYDWTPDYFTTTLTHHLQTRKVVELLHADAVLQCHECRLPQACDSVIAMVHAGRALDDEPAGLSQLARLSVQQAVVTMCERTLGHGELTEPALARLRELLLEERQHPITLLFIRGERAAQHHFYTNLESGAIDLAKLINKEGDWKEADERLWKGYIASGDAKRSHAFTLRTLNRFLDEMKRPEPGALQAVREVSQMARAGDFGEPPLLASLLMPAVHKIAGLENLNKLHISCAVIGLAAESFRLKSKRWPRDVRELQESGLLPQVPADPFYSFDKNELSKPLRFRHTDNGIVVHSIVAPRDYDGDARDDLTSLTPDEWHDRHIAEFRVWNPESRRLSPRPVDGMP